MSGAHHAHDDHEHRPVWQYVLVFVILGLITFIELGPLFEWFNIPTAGLLVLSVGKFVLVVGFFMHLWDDAKVYTQIFTPPLIGATLMVSVLMLLFYSYFPSPRTDAFPVAERHWENYNGECQSWLRSHVSNRWYCASPPIARDRIVAYTGPKGAGGPPAPDLDLSGLSEADALAALMEAGETGYKNHCQACHQADGKGLPPAFPPLAQSDYIDDANVHIDVVLNGLSGPITVNGVDYNGVMQAFGNLSDDEVAAIVTYERKSWGNDLSVVTPEEVAARR